MATWSHVWGSDFICVIHADRTRNFMGGGINHLMDIIPPHILLISFIILVGVSVRN